MFLAQAHSFAQQARLAITLSFVAGYTNILAVLTCGHVVSHMTGAVAELGQQSAAGRFWLAGFALLLLTAFFLGAALAGVLTELGRIRGWRSMYVWPMSFQGLLLCLFALLVELHDERQIETGAMRMVMTMLAAAAMGLQNATITRISGGVVRTTHSTGVLTDLGMESALLVLRRSHNDQRVGVTATWATPKRLLLLAPSLPLSRVVRSSQRLPTR